MSIGDIHIHINEDQSKKDGVTAKQPVAPSSASRKNNKSPDIEMNNLPAAIQPVFPSLTKRVNSSSGAKNGGAKRGSRLSTSRSPSTVVRTAVVPNTLQPIKKKRGSRLSTSRNPSTVVQTAVMPNVIRPKKKKRGFFSKAASFAKKVAKASIAPGLPGVIKLATRKRVAATPKPNQPRAVRNRIPVAKAAIPRMVSRPVPQQAARRVVRPVATSRLAFNRKRR